MNLNIKLATDCISKKNGQNHMMIEICPAKNLTLIPKPNAWVFVVDKSSSMREFLGNKINYTPLNITYGNFSMLPKREEHEVPTKMEYAKSSIIGFLNKLTEQDKVGVVEFNSYANIVSELAPLTDKKKIIKKIEEMEPSGCTNIDAGINLGRSLFDKKDLDKYNCKIIVLSDGETNEGRQSAEELSSMTLEFLKDGITTSCIGVGNEYNSYLLNKIATSGGGYLYHVDDLTKIDKFFQEELDLSNNVLAKSVELEISSPTYLEIEQNLNNYYEENKDDYKKIFVGDLTSNRKVAIGFKNNFRTEDATFKIKCTYKALNDFKYTIEAEQKVKIVEDTKNAEKNLEVIDYVMSLMKSRAQAEAMLYAEKRDKSKVSYTYAQSISSMGCALRSYNMSDSYTAATLDSMTVAQSNCVNMVDTASTADIKASYSTETSKSRK